MSDDVSNPKAPEIQGVPVDHPSLKRHLEGCARNGTPVSVAAKTAGVPLEVAYAAYRRVAEEKKK